MQVDPNAAFFRAMKEAEVEYFEEEKLGDLVQQGRATTGVLVSCICDLYGKYLLESWVPRTLDLLAEKSTELQAADSELGLPRAHDAGAVAKALQGPQGLPALVAKSAERTRSAARQRARTLSDEVLQELEEHDEHLQAFTPRG